MSECYPEYYCFWLENKEGEKFAKKQIRYFKDDMFFDTILTHKLTPTEVKIVEDFLSALWKNKVSIGFSIYPTWGDVKVSVGSIPFICNGVPDSTVSVRELQNLLLENELDEYTADLTANKIAMQEYFAGKWLLSKSKKRIIRYRRILLFRVSNRLFNSARITPISGELNYRAMYGRRIYKFRSKIMYGFPNYYYLNIQKKDSKHEVYASSFLFKIQVQNKNRLRFIRAKHPYINFDFFSHIYYYYFR